MGKRKRFDREADGEKKMDGFESIVDQDERSTWSDGGGEESENEEIPSYSHDVKSLSEERQRRKSCKKLAKADKTSALEPGTSNVARFGHNNWIANREMGESEEEDSDQNEPFSDSHYQGQDSEEGGNRSESDHEDDSEGNDDQQTQDSIRNDLSNMTFEELQQLKERLGMKVYKEAVFGKREKRGRKNFKRANKNRPREMSAKAPVSTLRNVFEVKKSVYKDPRFDTSAGAYSERHFRNTYSFVGDIRKKERETLEKMLSEENDPEEKQKIKKLIQRMKNQEATDRLKDEQMNVEKEYQNYLEEQVKEGNKPVYLNKSVKKKIILAERFKKLKKAGKLEKYLEKRRKKNAYKERKKLPVK